MPAKLAYGAVHFNLPCCSVALANCCSGCAKVHTQERAEKCHQASLCVQSHFDLGGAPLKLKILRNISDTV